ncbi:MAG: tetratricopeptide repeat protein [Gemmatimonadetes bacterium]|nr:tetratricopeptide repeat protein [Gemmatimonadota bacterium]
MADIAKLKKKAAEFEAAKKMDKAIAVYREILDVYDAGGESDIEVALYNRVGDLLMKAGDTGEAVTLYERAVDLYAEGGFFNNAIALCNKVLRSSPGRASVYYKLGKISAAKGFNGDAKQNFLEYADRMQKAGKKDEAFRALKEFADLCPDQDDVRLMLADQLLKADRKGEAVEQLLTLLELYQSSGRATEADATQERIRAIDPDATPRTAARKSVESKATAHDDLIFIDLDAPTPRKSRLSVAAPTVERKPEPPPPPAPPPPPVAPPEAPAPPVLEGLEATPLTGIERTSLVGIESTSLAGIESTSVDAGSAPPEAAGALLGLETTSLVPEAADEAAPLSASEFAELDLSGVEEVKAPAREAGRDLALPGDLPLIDTSMEVVAAASGLVADIPLLDLEAEAPPAAEPRPSGDIELLDLTEAPEAAAAAPSAADELGFIDLDAAPAETAAAPEVEEPTGFGEVDVEFVEAPTPPVRRTTTMAIPMLASSIDDLREQVAREPENWNLRRQLAEAMLDEGQRDEGLAMLEESMAGFEGAGQIHDARSVADEIVRLNPTSVRFHQKRVEFAFRADDKPGLAQAYLDLADALFREGQTDKAKAVYLRVLEIAADDVRASSALESLSTTAPAAAPAPEKRPSVASPGRRYTGMLTAIPEPPPAAEAPAAKADEDFVSLGDWLRDEEEPKSTRMVVEEKEPTGDEDADFQDMLRKFKQGVAQNVDEGDHESHYDLGVAYKEMGLLDEAIAEFQKALRGAQLRVRTYEALGQCFLEKGQLPVALTILQRALVEPGVGDDQLVGVLYLLGYVSEGLKKAPEAKAYYERVFAVDIQFRDIGDRLRAVDAVSS